MSYSCLDYLGALPTLDVVAICARDTAGQAAFRAHGLVAGFGSADPTDTIMLLGGILVGALVLTRLAAFLYAVGGIAWRVCGQASERHHRPEPRTLVERHRGRPAGGRIERGDHS